MAGDTCISSEQAHRQHGQPHDALGHDGLGVLVAEQQHVLLHRGLHVEQSLLLARLEVAIPYTFSRRSPQEQPAPEGWAGGREAGRQGGSEAGGGCDT